MSVRYQVEQNVEYAIDIIAGVCLKFDIVQYVWKAKVNIFGFLLFYCQTLNTLISTNNTPSKFIAV